MTDRDYLKEARDIIAGMSMMLPEREHLVQLQAYYRQRLRDMNGILEECKVTIEERNGDV